MFRNDYELSELVQSRRNDLLGRQPAPGRITTTPIKGVAASRPIRRAVGQRLVALGTVLIG